MTQVEMDRRKFLAASGCTVFAFSCLDIFGEAFAKEQAENVMAWVVFEPNGKVVIFNPAAEMGQGSGTTLPMIVAEELDLDWQQVEVQTSPVDKHTYGFDFYRGYTMLTAGSWTVRRYFTRLRLVGAKLRRLMMEEAARQWKVPLKNIKTEKGMVVYKNKSVAYHKLAMSLKKPVKVPEVSEKDLKDPKDFRILGRSLARYDGPAKIDGRALYSIDVVVPNMLYAVIARSPRHNDKPVNFDENAVRAKYPKVKTVKLDYGVGFVGPSFEMVEAARQMTQISWANKAESKGFNSEKELNSYKSYVQKDHQKQSMETKGDVDAASAKAKGPKLSRSYFSDFAYHSQMEPLNAVADVDMTKIKAEIWVGSQNPAGVKTDAAKLLGLSESNIKVNQMLLGGGFGRRSMSDFAIEAVELSRALKTPVKLVWTREDDIAWGAFRPMSMMKIDAHLDDKGSLVSWRQCTMGDGPHLQRSGVTIPDYNVPHQDIYLSTRPHGMRLKHWRSVGHNANKFAIECMIDELAASSGQDPLQFRLKLMEKSPRAKKVVEAVAKMSDFSNRRKSKKRGRGFGLAYVDRSQSFGAAVCELSVDQSNGRLKIHNFWVAVDAGLILNPDNAKAQIEGGVVFGISSAVKERVTVSDGVVKQSNFHDYEIARMSDTPEIFVEFIDSLASPTGVGESSTPLVAPAIANAIADATGKWVRHMPMNPERVMAALAEKTS